MNAAEILRQTALAHGIEQGYFDIYGNYHATDEQVIQCLANAMTPMHPPTDAVLWVAQHAQPELLLPENWTFSGSQHIVLTDEQQQPMTLPIHMNGHRAAVFLPENLAVGYYRVAFSDRELSGCLIVAPPCVYQPSRHPHNGLTLQLYALQSAQNWGVGDLGDLADLMAICATQHIDFIGINPLHALYTSRPEFASPYSPSSRRWLNPMYLSVPKIAQYIQSSAFETYAKTLSGSLKTLRDTNQVDYAQVWRVKSAALRHLFDEFERDNHVLQQTFTEFIAQHGDDLRGFALFETLDNHFANREKLGWLGWDTDYHNPNSPQVNEFSEKNQSTIRFHMWLQWLCAVQLADVNAAAAQHGITLRLYGDLAVGVAQGSADTWLQRDQYCLDLAIGAPPDPFSPIGQNWQLPPYNPRVMHQTACAEWLKIIRENMKLYGILRIDHVMALNRLWLIVGQNETADKGAYVHYPQEALFAILAVESHRNQCVVVGEDLGTVPNETRELLNRYQIYSYKVLYFNQNMHEFPQQSIAVMSTHDLAPLAGWWQGQDLHTMFALGTLPDEHRFQAALAQRDHDKTQLIDLLKQNRALPPDFRQPEHLSAELWHALHAFAATTPAQLYALQLENLLNMKENFNIPSVATGNWTQKYPLPIAELPQHFNFNRICQLTREIRMTQPRQYPALDQQERQTINTLFTAEHGNVFAYLGQHDVAGVGNVIRALLPNALRVHVLDEQGNTLANMEKIDERGLWAVVLPETLAKYTFSIKYNELENPILQDDPYRYGSFLGDTDHWLLGEGRELRPYEKLGAHLREMDGTQGAYFAVWCPNAQRVSVVGEFNHWDGRVHVMRKHHDTGVWEIFIPHVPFNALYKFEIRDANGHVRVKSDPYAFASELRPTTASVLRGLPEKVPAPAFRQAANAIDAPISIYEVHLGSWKRTADNQWLTYQQLATELIDYVKEMGFTHIELLPIAEYPFDGSWGYQATGLYAPTSRFGSPQELQALIQAAHQAGISVILDWVVGHFPTDEHGLAKFDGTSLYEHQDPREGYHQDWNTLIYNFGRNEVRNFLSGNALYWVEHFGFDGLRVDAVASMIYRDYSRKDGEWIPNQFGGRENLEAIEFLRNTNIMLQNQGLHATGIAEESTAFPNVTKAEGLAFQYKWNMGWMNDTLRYMKEDPINRKYHHNLMTFGMMYQYSENYVLPLSHDEVVHGKGSLLAKMSGDCWQKFANLRAYYGFMFGYPGKKLLFMGNEFAQGREWNFNESLDWHLLDEAHGGGWHKGVQDFVRDLNHTYRNHAPLYQLDQWQDGFEWLVADDGNHSIFVFERKDRAGNRMIIISNFTPVIRENYRFGVNAAGEYRVVLNSDEMRYMGNENTLSGSLKTEKVASHGRAHSLNLTVPPLATVYLYLAATDTLPNTPNPMKNKTKSSTKTQSTKKKNKFSGRIKP